ncbi:unnamed protein product [Closterium sp. NIES-53]
MAIPTLAATPLASLVATLPSRILLPSRALLGLAFLAATSLEPFHAVGRASTFTGSGNQLLPPKLLLKDLSTDPLKGPVLHAIEVDHHGAPRLRQQGESLVALDLFRVVHTSSRELQIEVPELIECSLHGITLVDLHCMELSLEHHHHRFAAGGMDILHYFPCLGTKLDTLDEMLDVVQLVG